jgi:hypothetical protein
MKSDHGSGNLFQFRILKKERNFRTHPHIGNQLSAFASDMGIEPKFCENQSKRKKHFDKINYEEEQLQQSVIESFRVNYSVIRLLKLQLSGPVVNFAFSPRKI